MKRAQKPSKTRLFISDGMRIPRSLEHCSDGMRPYAISGVKTPKTPAVYLLMRNGKVVYVGQSVKMSHRVGSHSSEKLFDYVLAIRTSIRCLDIIESDLVYRLRPRLNKTTPPIHPKAWVAFCDFFSRLHDPLDECHYFSDGKSKLLYQVQTLLQPITFHPRRGVAITYDPETFTDDDCAASLEHYGDKFDRYPWLEDDE